jgi:hypothetical protein
MLRRISLFAALLLAACGGGSGAAAPGTPEARAEADPLVSWIAAAAERLSEAAGVLGDDAGEARDGLRRIAADAEAGRALFALSRIPSIRQRIEARGYRAERLETVADLPALEQDATALGAELDRAEARIAAALPERPAAVRALAESARVHARADHGAALAYARVTSVDSGLFYLGGADSLMGTAVDLAELPVSRPGPGPSASSRAPSAAALEAELDGLDRRAIAAYREPGTETDQHSAFIALNAEIKEARDLLAAGREHGALLAALEVRRRLEELADDGSGPGSEAGEEALRRRAGEARTRLEAAGWDASLGLLMLETAEDSLAAEDPSEAALRRARALLLHVLPRYFEFHQETS